MLPRCYHDDHKACLISGPIDVEGFNSDTRDNSINLGSDEDEIDNEPLIVTSKFRYEEWHECLQENTWSWSNPLSFKNPV